MTNKSVIKLIVFSFFTILLAFGCKSEKKLQHHQGYALGTSYHIQYESILSNYDKVQTGIDSVFTRINSSMSTYLPNSDLSKINKGDSVVVVDNHFRNVFNKANEVWNVTKGYFDPTVGAWVNAYGFGPEKPLKIITKKERERLLSITGWDKVQLNLEGNIKKDYPDIYIDFNALAKGYTVDVLRDYLISLDAINFLIELGGEIVAKGVNPKFGKPWRIAIDNPVQKKERSLIQTLVLENQAIATSGNYRKFRIDSITGERYVHSINPLSGYPVRSNILSTSVIALDCMTADAYATALMVMPLEESQKIISSLKNIEAYWIVSDKDTIREIFSKGWKK